MAVSNGQQASASVFNAAFVSKSVDSTMQGIYTLSNADTASGSSVANFQREFNAIWSFLGGSLDQVKTYKPTFASDNIGATGNDTVERIDAIQAVVETNQTDIAALSTVSTWDKYTVPASSFSAESSSQTISLFTLAASGTIEGVILKHSEAFGGGTITDYKISVGPSGDSEKYVSQHDVDQTVAASTIQVVQLLEVEDLTSTTTIVIKADATGDDVANATSGSVDVWVKTGVLS